MYENIYFKIFSSIILNVHNEPCFEDKSSSFTIYYEISSGTLFRIKLYMQGCKIVHSIEPEILPKPNLKKL